jgi:hypothetical protein
MAIHAGGIDDGLHIPGGAIDVAIELELQCNTGLTGRAVRGHLDDIGNLAEMSFERLGDARRNGGRTGARKLGNTEIVGYQPVATARLVTLRMPRCQPGQCGPAMNGVELFHAARRRRIAGLGMLASADSTLARSTLPGQTN